MSNSSTANRAGRKAMPLFAAGLLALAMPAATLAQSPPADEADILIANGKIIDGSGSPWRQGNVAIKGDTIVYVGTAPVKAKRVIDAKGQAVSPGFIDMHAHSEFGLSLDGHGLSKTHPGRDHRSVGRAFVRGPGAAGGGRSHDDYAAGQADLDDACGLLRHPDQEGYRAECGVLCRRRPASPRFFGDGLCQSVQSHAGWKWRA